MENKLSFKIIAPSGHAFEVYENGTVEGFPEGSIVINRAFMYSTLEKAANLIGIKVDDDRNS